MNSHKNARLTLMQGAGAFRRELRPARPFRAA